MLINKVLHKLFTLLRSIPYRILGLRLKRIYNQQFSRNPQSQGAQETMPLEIIEFGMQKRAELLELHLNKYRSKPYRFLFHLPPDGVGAVWFKDLAKTLEHTGIACQSVKYADPSFRQTWEAFQPNIIVSIDVPYMLKDLDLEYIQRYKQEHGCFRFFTSYPNHRFPKPGLSPEDQWRLDLAISGKSADAFFSMFADAYYEMFQPEWANAGFDYLELPHGCNLFYQYPRPANKEYDYFIATSYGPERVKMTWQYMRPIFEQYHGAWAGPGWSFGVGPLENEQLPEYYARTKIVPNPMSTYLKTYPMEISERAFSCLACGVFQITDWTPVTEKFFSQDELVWVHSRQEFLDRFAYYLNRPAERYEIVMRGMMRLYTEHTYFHRIDKLISFLENKTPQF